MDWTTPLAPHQVTAVNCMDNGKILVGGVGTGKSRVAAGYYVKMEADLPIYVITTARKRDDLDWEKEFAKFGVGKNDNATCAGKLTVDSWQNIGKYENVKGCFFIFDEQRIVGSGQWSQKFIKIAKRNRWILLTATPGDSWMDYVSVFIANGFYANRTEFKREHVVYSTWSKFPKVDRYLGVGKMLRQRNALLVHMPYKRHTVRVVERIECEYDRDLMKAVVEKRWHVYENRPLRNAAEMCLVARKVVNSHPSRMDAVRKLLLLHRRLIVFYNFDYELESLRKLGRDVRLAGLNGGDTWKDTETAIGIRTTTPDAYSRGGSTATLERTAGLKLISGSAASLTVAEWNGHKHEKVPPNEDWLYLVQYIAGAEAWNCTRTDAMCFYSRNYSYKIDEQARGRIDRLNTPFQVLKYYLLSSDSDIDRAIERSLESKKDFNESAFVRSW